MATVRQGLYELKELSSFSLIYLKGDFDYVLAQQVYHQLGSEINWSDMLLREQHPQAPYNWGR